MDEATAEDTLAVRRMLGLDPTAQEFAIVYASIARNDRELAILSRSILEIIIDLASFMMFIFTLVETGGKEGAPIVTIPAG